MKKLIAMLLVLGTCALGMLDRLRKMKARRAQVRKPQRKIPMVLTLSHGLSETHTVHIAMEEFAKKVEDKTEGRIKMEIFPNGQLGSETESMEQLMPESSP